MLSVVIPCYNEQDVLPQLLGRVRAAAETWGEPFEVILVDDGSTDETWDLIAGMHRLDPRFKGIRLARNFGQQIAITAGLRHASGDAVMHVDADLQDPPEQLQQFIDKWREGYEVVYAVRVGRKENPLKRLCYRVFYRIQNKLADIRMPLDSGDFGLMDRKVVDLLNRMPERNRFVRGLRSWVGFRQTGVQVERAERAAGKVKYSFRQLLKLAHDGLFAFSTAPLRLATWLGFGVSVLAMLGVVFTFFQRVFAPWFASIGLGPVPGFATTVIAILFLGGVQLICLGIIGEYLGRIYDEVKGRPLWTTQQTLGLDAERTHTMRPAA